MDGKAMEIIELEAGIIVTEYTMLYCLSIMTRQGTLIETSGLHLEEALEKIREESIHGFSWMRIKEVRHDPSDAA